MMTMRNIIKTTPAAVLCIGAVISGAEVRATDLTGAALAYACRGNVPGFTGRDKKTEESARFCNTYINGWDDARFAFLQGTVTYCPPGITAKELSVVFFDYLATHREARKLPAAEALMAAFKDKWPCR
jgi:Rap1a immunity proteins